MRCVHLALLRDKRSLERAGVRGAKVQVSDSEGKLLELPSGVYCMPVLRDYATTYQWLRELKRGHGLPMVAVHFTVPDSEMVWVGRFGTRHEWLPARAAFEWIEKNPFGSQMLVPRSFSAKEVEAIRELPQLVGWKDIPEEDRKTECCCTACLPPGMPDLLPRIRGVYQRALHDLRRASDAEAATGALARMQIPFERAHGRLSPSKLFSQANSPYTQARESLCMLLGLCRWPDVAEVMRKLLVDSQESVQAQAVYYTWCALGSRRAAEFVRDFAAAEHLFEWLGSQDPRHKSSPEEGLKILAESAVPAVAGRAQSSLKCGFSIMPIWLP